MTLKKKTLKNRQPEENQEVTKNPKNSDSADILICDHGKDIGVTVLAVFTQRPKIVEIMDYFGITISDDEKVLLCAKLWDGDRVTIEDKEYLFHKMRYGFK